MRSRSGILATSVAMIIGSLASLVTVVFSASAPKAQLISVSAESVKMVLCCTPPGPSMPSEHEYADGMCRLLPLYACPELARLQPSLHLRGSTDEFCMEQCEKLDANVGVSFAPISPTLNQKKFPGVPPYFHSPSLDPSNTTSLVSPTTTTIEQICDDQLDNDGDWLIDTEDPDCAVDSGGGARSDARRFF